MREIRAFRYFWPTGLLRCCCASSKGFQGSVTDQPEPDLIVSVNYLTPLDQISHYSIERGRMGRPDPMRADDMATESHDKPNVSTKRAVQQREALGSVPQSNRKHGRSEDSSDAISISPQPQPAVSIPEPPRRASIRFPNRMLES